MYVVISLRRFMFVIVWHYATTATTDGGGAGTVSQI